MRALLAGYLERQPGPDRGGPLKCLMARGSLPSRRTSELQVVENGLGLGAAQVFQISAGTTALAQADDAAVVLDGWLAREHLPTSDAPKSDAQLALELYREVGLEIVNQLSGEFAIIIADHRDRKLIAIRDPFGTRQLFWRTDRNRVEVASQLWQLFEPTELSSNDIDLDFVGTFLAKQSSVGEATSLRSIRRLRSGSYLLALSSTPGVSSERYWTPVGHVRQVDMEAEEAAGVFREMFFESIAATVRDVSKPWAELSGGLDSSSIVAAIAKGETGITPLAGTLTLTWPHTSASDESNWARLLADHAEVPNHQIDCTDLFFEGAFEDATYRSDPHFGILCHPMHRAEVEFLSAESAHVLLSGARAEPVVLDRIPPIHLSELLAKGNLIKLLSEAKRWQEGLSQPLLNILYWNCLRPLWKSHNVDHSAASRRSLAPWIHPEFVKDRQIGNSGAVGAAEKLFSSAADQYQYEKLVRSEDMMHRGIVEWSLDVRHPFLNRRLIEFSFSLPWSVMMEPRAAKTLLRKGLQRELPPEIKNRKNWSGPTAAAFKTLARKWGVIEPLLKSSLLVEMGIFDGREWQKAMQLARHGHAENFAELTSSLALEIWLRCLLKHEEL